MYQECLLRTTKVNVNSIVYCLCIPRWKTESQQWDKLLEFYQESAAKSERWCFFFCFFSFLYQTFHVFPFTAIVFRVYQFSFFPLLALLLLINFASNSSFSSLQDHGFLIFFSSASNHFYSISLASLSR